MLLFPYLITSRYATGYEEMKNEHRNTTDLEYLGSTWGLHRLGSVQHQLWLGNS